jgi:hypothetical protein
MVFYPAGRSRITDRHFDSGSLIDQDARQDLLETSRYKYDLRAIKPRYSVYRFFIP